MSKPGSLARAASVGYDEDGEEGDTSVILPSETGLRRARLRACSGSGEEMLKELDVDRLALTPERPSETLSDTTPARRVVANSLATRARVRERESKTAVVRRVGHEG
jgi:hypothetical protein